MSPDVSELVTWLISAFSVGMALQLFAILVRRRG